MFETLRTLLDRRILILDGAMGTMIQRYKLTEADFRGERFANHPRDLRGDSDVLVLTRPDVISAIHHEYLAAGADIIETNTFGGTTIAQADYALEDAVYDINFEGARLARAAADEWNAKTPGRPRFVAGAMGPTNRTLSISPDVNNPAYRATSFDEMRDAYELQVRAPARRRLRHHPARDDFRHAQRQVRPRRHRERVRGTGRPGTADDFRDRGRSQRPHAVGADHRRLLRVDPPRPALQRRHQLRARRPRHAAVPRRARAHRGVLRQQLSQRRAPECLRRVRRAAAGDRRAPARLRDQRLRQHPGRLLRHDAGAHHRHRGGGGWGRAAAARRRDRRIRTGSGQAGCHRDALAGRTDDVRSRTSTTASSPASRSSRSVPRATSRWSASGRT